MVYVKRVNFVFKSSPSAFARHIRKHRLDCNENYVSKISYFKLVIVVSLEIPSEGNLAGIE